MILIYIPIKTNIFTILLYFIILLYITITHVINIRVIGYWFAKSVPKKKKLSFTSFRFYKLCDIYILDAVC